MNNLEIFKENIHLIENIKLFSRENKLIYETLLTKLKSSEKLILQDILYTITMIYKKRMDKVQFILLCSTTSLMRCYFISVSCN